MLSDGESAALPADGGLQGFLDAGPAGGVALSFLMSGRKSVTPDPGDRVAPGRGASSDGGRSPEDRVAGGAGSRRGRRRAEEAQRQLQATGVGDGQRRRSAKRNRFGKPASNGTRHGQPVKFVLRRPRPAARKMKTRWLGAPPCRGGSVAAASTVTGRKSLVVKISGRAGVQRPLRTIASGTGTAGLPGGEIRPDDLGRRSTPAP